jgi:hypothetical protein
MASLLIRNKPDVYKAGMCCKKKYDIIEVQPDNFRFGRLGGSHGRESPLNGMGNFIQLRVYVPGLSLHMKPAVEGHVERYERDRNIGEFVDDIKQTLYLPRTYYLDYDALPEWAKRNLEFAGECSLPAHIAHQVIKRREDDTQSRELFYNMVP